MNLSEALARDVAARPARVLHGAQTWKTVRVPRLSDAPAVTGGRPRSNAAAAAEADAARIEARIAEAFQEGLLEGRRQVEADVAARDEAAFGALTQRCNQVADDLAQGIQALESQLADRMLTLSMTLAERIVCRSVELAPDAVVPVLAEVMATVTAPWRELEVVANPQDCPIIDEWLRRREGVVADAGAVPDAAGLIGASLTTTAPADGRSASGVTITVRADPAVSPGGCRVRIDETRFDAMLETRIRRVFDAMGRDDEQP